MADTTGRTLTYGEMLTGALCWRRASACAASDPAKWSASCCPPPWPARWRIVSLTLRGVVPVNLNFTAGAEAMQSAMEQCGIRTVISSRAFLAKAKLGPLPGTIYLEDQPERGQQHHRRIAIVRRSDCTGARRDCHRAAAQLAEIATIGVEHQRTALDGCRAAVLPS